MDASRLRIAVTGHRPKHLFGYDFTHPGWQWIREQLAGVVAEFSGSAFLSGMALGVDQVFAEEVLFDGGHLEAYLPFEGQDAAWPEHARRHYRQLLRDAAVRHWVSNRGDPEAFWKRNQALVDACDVVVAVWSGKEEGGTFHCLQAALRAGRPVMWVDVEGQRVVLVA